jgi:hypothetical protein
MNARGMGNVFGLSEARRHSRMPGPKERCRLSPKSAHSIRFTQAE